MQMFFGQVFCFLNNTFSKLDNFENESIKTLHGFPTVRVKAGAFWNVVKTGQTHFPVFFNYIFHFSSWRHTLFKLDGLK